MAFKLINAVEARPGVAILVDDTPCIVKSNDISKTGKHGHAKCRIEAVSVIDGKKKVFVISGHERLECPMINKRKGQILSISGENASVMDLESYETIDFSIPKDLKENLKDGDQVEYWDVEGTKVIKRKI
jgi:translation initiation factor 5A